MTETDLWTAAARAPIRDRLSVMLRALCSALAVLMITAGCARSTEKETKAPPTPSSAVARLLELANSPEVRLDPIDAPKAPKGFNRSDVLRLAGWLVDAVERTSTADASVESIRDAIDHTFSALDMKSRLQIRDWMVEMSRDQYKSMPVEWTIVDRWEPGHEPAAPPRIIKAGWDTHAQEGYLTVTLQVVQAYVSVAGEPMFLRRTFALQSSDPARSPAVPVYFWLTAGVTAIDRCHVVRTGRFRPEQDASTLAKLPTSLERHVKAKGVDDSGGGDFRGGCD